MDGVCVLVEVGEDVTMNVLVAVEVADGVNVWDGVKVKLGVLEAGGRNVQVGVTEGVTVGVDVGVDDGVLDGVIVVVGETRAGVKVRI